MVWELLRRARRMRCAIWFRMLWRVLGTRGRKAGRGIRAMLVQAGIEDPVRAPARVVRAAAMVACSNLATCRLSRSSRALMRREALVVQLLLPSRRCKCTGQGANNLLQYIHQQRGRRPGAQYASNYASECIYLAKYIMYTVVHNTVPSFVALFTKRSSDVLKSEGVGD